MKELASILRALQLYSHNAHNYVQGPSFFQDHEFLGELYPEYESDYDDMIERIIGLYGSDSLDLNIILDMAVSKLRSYPIKADLNSVYFEAILHCEKELCDHVEKLVKVSGVTQGSIQLITEIANKSEIRQYKLKQRIGK